MTTTLPRPISITPVAPGYPALLRMGHVFHAVVGQRLVVGGFYGPLDLAIAEDGMMYVLNKIVDNADYPRNRFVPVSIRDEYGPDIVPMVNGKRDENGNEFLPSPVGCTMDAQDILYATDEHANVVVRFTVAGETLGWWGEAGDEPGKLNAPSGIAPDAEGNLWVVSTRSHCVQRFTPDGKYLGGFGGFGTEPGRLNYPWGVAVDPINGSIFVADWRNHRVQRFSPDGELMQVIGRPGSGVGELDHPSGVAVDMHGDIYVVDRGNHRVLQFNHRGMFIESFIGDAPMTERGADKLMTNPDMCRMRENIEDLDREKRFFNPTSVKVDNKGLVYIVDTGRFRVQIYRKTYRVLLPHQIDPPTMHVDPVVT